MLSDTDVTHTAAVLLDRLGEVAIAAAVLRAQEAARDRRYHAMENWRRIAAAVVGRVTAREGLPLAAWE
jgi:hypothetical protein